jgi:uncharacterized Zn finger protein
MTDDFRPEGDNKGGRNRNRRRRAKPAAQAAPARDARPPARAPRPMANATGARPMAQADGEVLVPSAQGDRNRQGRGKGDRFAKQAPAGNRQGQGRSRRERRVRPAGREGLEILHATEPAAPAAQTWWGEKWLKTLQRFGWKGRLANGRLYAQEGRVTEFHVESGRIVAKVLGTRPEPYEVEIRLKPLPDTDWDLVVEIMSCQALFAAQLLASDMPPDVEEAFEAAHAPLFPRNKEDLQAKCSCPDYANPCKHIAAAYYVTADHFDQDPFLIFHLRGRSRDQLLGMLRAARAAEAQFMTLDIETMDTGHEVMRFWQCGDELETVHISIAPPSFPGVTAKKLGRPPFWRGPSDPITRLPEVYEAIARRAREVALTEPLVGAGQGT